MVVEEVAVATEADSTTRVPVEDATGVPVTITFWKALPRTPRRTQTGTATFEKFTSVVLRLDNDTQGGALGRVEPDMSMVDEGVVVNEVRQGPVGLLEGAWATAKGPQSRDPETDEKSLRTVDPSVMLVAAGPASTCTCCS